MTRFESEHWKTLFSEESFGTAGCDAADSSAVSHANGAVDMSCSIHEGGGEASKYSWAGQPEGAGGETETRFEEASRPGAVGVGGKEVSQEWPPPLSWNEAPRTSYSSSGSGGDVYGSTSSCSPPERREESPRRGRGEPLKPASKSGKSSSPARARNKKSTSPSSRSAKGRNSGPAKRKTKISSAWDNTAETSGSPS